MNNRNGAILVTGWDKEELALSAEIRDSDQRRIELVVRAGGADLDIERPVPAAHAEPDLRPRRQSLVPDDPNVPHRLLGQFRTTNGPITVATVQGYVRCETTKQYDG